MNNLISCTHNNLKGTYWASEAGTVMEVVENLYGNYTVRVVRQTWPAENSPGYWYLNDLMEDFALFGGKKAFHRITELPLKSSEALRHAKAHIEVGIRGHLCTALQLAGGRHTQVYYRLQGLLKVERINVIESWLRRNHRAVFDEFARESPQFTTYRLAWIDWLIPQYEAVGD